MIIPCMNSTSARDFGGSVPRVDGGRVLLGFPGSPGCTMTGTRRTGLLGTSSRKKQHIELRQVTPHSSRIGLLKNG